ncbi:hypothetical protein PAHAL_6G288500 [Panicum hallii]|uniref:Uncharacterized protein n=1 Tax=Panicum hallii TaxID=206008 RepID=A0A2T8II47_9POAL|nr:hypothetical protein PAHAL_6G288500 [Panicum hallii]
MLMGKICDVADGRPGGTRPGTPARRRIRFTPAASKLPLQIQGADAMSSPPIRFTHVEPKESLHLHCKGSGSFFASKYMKLMFAGWKYLSTTDVSFRKAL